MKYSETLENELVAQEAALDTQVNDIALRCREAFDKHGGAESGKGDGWDAKDTNSYMALETRHRSLERQLEVTRERLEKLREVKPLTPEAAKAQSESAIARWLRGGTQALSAEERQSFEAPKDIGKWDFGGTSMAGTKTATAFRGPDEGDVRAAHRRRILNGGAGASDRRATATGLTGNTGANLIDTDTRQRVVERLKNFGGVRKAAQLWTTAQGNPITIPRADETAVEGELLGVAANRAVTVDDLENFGATTFNAYTYSSKKITITMEMLQDTSFDLLGYAERQTVRRLGRITNKHFTTGDGSSKPRGVVNVAAAGVTAAAAAKFTWEELLELQYKVDDGYLEGSETGPGGSMAETGDGGMVGYMMSRGAEYFTRQLSDSDNRPLWIPTIRDGLTTMMALIHGYPYVLNYSMDAVATAKIPVLFGNFDYFVVRSARDVMVYNFWDSQTAANYGIEIMAFCREDSDAIGALESNSLCEAFVKLTMA